jgi:hypothetical protein
MAKIPISDLKTFFETGDRPNGTDYENLIDTLAAQATDLGTAGNNENVIFGIENQTVVDSFKASEWRLIKYLVSISKTTNGDNRFYATEISILVDGQNLNVAEYGTLDNNGDMGTINVSKSGDTVELTVTPNSNIKPVTVRYARIGLKA